MLSNRVLFTAFAVLTVMAGLVIAEGKLKISPDQQYLLLATTKTSTMQKELDEAASMGFRIVTGSPTSGAEMALLMERVDKEQGKYQYLLLATTRTSTMQKELNEETAKGYRLLTETMIAKKQLFGGDEIVVVLEKPQIVDRYYQYLLLATTRTGTLQKEVNDARSEGYVITGMVSRGEHMVIMEKQLDKQPR